MFSWRWKCKAVQYLGKILPENLPGGSSNILSNFRRPPSRLESPCLFNLYTNFVMPVFMNNCTKDDSVRFFKHQYRINTRSISREQWFRMRNESVKLWRSSTVLWWSYVDSLILFMLDILDEVFTNHGLYINVSKQKPWF